ncbi:hypothetical protein CGK39_22930 [Vibrio parahaemolyticus]|uniref:transposase n=1 Tax=Vibrio parahaemolyticus TaxID=670 RepID=UPI00111CEEBE|nr:hypothetical protein CGK39_22930 [Vibrio parahaemolyticus]
MPKPRYKPNNWYKYNNSLLNRGSLTFWIDEEVTTEWKQSKQDKRGRPRLFSDLAITTALMVKRVFSLPLRRYKALSTLFLDWRMSLVPHYTSVSRRAKGVEANFKASSRDAIQHLANMQLGSIVR